MKFHLLIVLLALLISETIRLITAILDRDFGLILILILWSLHLILCLLHMNKLCFSIRFPCSCHILKNAWSYQPYNLYLNLVFFWIIRVVVKTFVVILRNVAVRLVAFRLAYCCYIFSHLVSMLVYSGDFISKCNIAIRPTLTFIFLHKLITPFIQLFIKNINRLNKKADHDDFIALQVTSFKSFFFIIKLISTAIANQFFKQLKINGHYN